MPARSLELQVSPGVSVFGEVLEVDDAHGAVLLLHDRGTDLDAMRAFAAPLRSLGLTTVLLDLPGDGLSAGDWDTDGMRAVRRALDECRSLHPAVAAVAAGAACSLLYGVHPAPVCAAALVAPRLGHVALSEAEAWRVVPSVTMGDPCDEVVTASMDAVSRWIRAWSLRLSVHYLDPPDGGPGRWTAHMTHATAAFLAEQLAYAARPHPAAHEAVSDHEMRAPSAPGDSRDEEVST